MTILPLFEALPEMLSAVSIESNGVGLLGMLIGIAAGWYLTSSKSQLKAKKAKIEKPQRPDDTKP